MEAGIPQTTVSSCTPTATGRSIAKRWMWHDRVPQGAFARLELLEGKLSRAVLRGLSGSNPTRLPGTRHALWANGPYFTQRPDPLVEGGRPRGCDGHLLCPPQLPGAPHALAANGLIGI